LDSSAAIRNISKGQTARVGLLVALAYRPELLVLDEPSTGLDPVVRRDILDAIMHTIADEGRTVLFSSHILDEVERVADHVTMISHGKMVLSGTLGEIRESNRVGDRVPSLDEIFVSRAAQRDLSRWNEVADREGLIVVYPSGTGFPRVWHAIRPGAALTADVRFIADLIDTPEAEFNIDPALICADGMSNGGGMAFFLSCTLSDRIAAVGLVASAQFLPWSWCTDRRAVPMIAFHGTADRLAPYRGGISWVSPDRFAATTTWAANWAQRNRCSANTVESAVTGEVTRLEYMGCADDAAVILYTVIGGGHTWPGGMPLPQWLAGSTSNSVSAIPLIWSFFRDHPLGPPRSRVEQN